MLQTEVVITGVGVLCPIGTSKDRVWDALAAGRSGVRTIEFLRAMELPVTIGGLVEDFDPKPFVPNRKSLKVMPRDAQFGVAAAMMAARDAEVQPGQVAPARYGVLLGSDRISNPLSTAEPAFRACMVDGRFDFSHWGKEGMQVTFPLLFLTVLPNMVASHVSIALDARGPSNTIHQGDISGLLAVAEAAQIVQRGAADLMLAGGASCQTQPFDWVRGAAMGRLSTRNSEPAAVCRPFDADRSGEVFGEGAATVALEARHSAQARGAKIRAGLAGWSAASGPAAIERAVGAALAESGLSPADIDHVNAHGASTVVDDAAEAQSLARVLPGTPVTAPKSFFGNLRAAAGAVELAMAVLALEHGVVPPTLNYHQFDPECPVEVLREARPLTRPAIVVLGRTPLGQVSAAVVTRP